MSGNKLFQYCSIQQKVVPVEEVKVIVPANIAHNYIGDDMPPTRNPLNPKEIYTSKSKLRAMYRAVGAEEIGTAYDNGYRPDNETDGPTNRLVARVMESVRERLNYGK